MPNFLIKTEPTSYAIWNLRSDGKTRWTGVRNYQARNYMTTDMKVGDLVLVYHSNADPPGVAGVARVSAEATPDPTQFDHADSHYEPRASRAKPLWFCVEIEFVAEAPEVVTLDALRANPALAQLEILRKGSRLSITPVSASDFLAVVKMAKIDLPKSPAHKSSAKKSPAQKSPAQKSSAQKSSAQKSPAKKSPAKKD